MLVNTYDLANSSNIFWRCDFIAARKGATAGGEMTIRPRPDFTLCGRVLPVLACVEAYFIRKRMTSECESSVVTGR
jgi:hypothetical protein